MKNEDGIVNVLIYILRRCNYMLHLLLSTEVPRVTAAVIPTR